MKIIDFRLRPPAMGFLNARIYTRPDIRNRFTRQLGFEPAPSAEEKSLELMFEEMAAAGIQQGVCVGRNSSVLGSVSNADVAAVAKAYPDKFHPVGSIEAATRKEAMAQMQEILDLGIRIVNLEPGVWATPMHVDDRRLYPLYAFCEDNGIPVIMMTGGNAGPDITYTNPEHIDRVLGDFPDLTVISSHGNWPWVQEIIHVAFRRPNLYLSPDMYLYNLPGHADFIQAANSFLADRMLFGTAYPMCPLKEYTEWFLTLPIKPDAMEKILHGNAERLLAQAGR